METDDDFHRDSRRVRDRHMSELIRKKYKRAALIKTEGFKRDFKIKYINRNVKFWNSLNKNMKYNDNCVSDFD